MRLGLLLVVCWWMRDLSHRHSSRRQHLCAGIQPRRVRCLFQSPEKQHWRMQDRWKARTKVLCHKTMLSHTEAPEPESQRLLLGE